jgi:hydrocephalus-inducing protein
VEFRSHILGEFSETFKWKLKGTKDLLTLTFKGHVIPPTFVIEPEEINFGVVSYMFTEK